MSFTAIKQRIYAEYRKHKTIDWVGVCAKKLDADYISRKRLEDAIDMVDNTLKDDDTKFLILKTLRDEFGIRSKL
jgi:hypothetical protein